VSASNSPARAAAGRKVERLLENIMGDYLLGCRVVLGLSAGAST